MQIIKQLPCSRAIAYSSKVVTAPLFHLRKQLCPTPRLYTASCITHVSVPVPNWRQTKHVCTAAAAHVSSSGENEEEEDEEEEEDSIASTSGLDLDLPRPQMRYQPKLSIKDIKAQRSRSNSLAKDKTLIRITVGQNGNTQSFLASCMDVLANHDLLRVKLGEGSGLERAETARTLEQYLDAVAVHQV